MNEREFIMLKEDLKKYVGKIPKKAKEKAKDTKQIISKKITTPYQKGVTKMQSNVIIDKYADLTGGLVEKNEDELLKNEDSTFTKIRKVIVNGTFILTPFIIGLPIKIIDKAIENNIDLKNAERYDDIYEKEILFTQNEIKKRKADGKDTKELQKYLNNLKTSRAKMQEHIKKIKEENKKQEKQKVANEKAMILNSNWDKIHPMAKFTYMQKEDFDSDDDFDEALIETFNSLLYEASKLVNPYIYLPEERKEEIIIDNKYRDSAYIISTNYIRKNIIGKNESQFMFSLQEQSNFISGKSNVMPLCELYSDNDNLNNMISEINDKISYANCKIITEKKNDRTELMLEGITQKAEDVVRKAVHTARDVLPEESPVAKGERITSPLDNAVNVIIQSARDALTHDRREEIINGKYRFKLIRIIGKCIVYGGIGIYFHPAIAAIAFLGKMAFDKHIDRKERSKIVQDLESELEICEEKIKDAEHKGDNENKYKLMRIRKSLQTETARIKLHLDK